MSTYAIIETGGEQLQVRSGRFYNIRNLATLKPTQFGPSTKILIYRVLMIRRDSAITIGHPWVKNAIVRGRILHNSSRDKLTIYKRIPKKKIRRKSGHRQNSTRFIVDSIYFNGEDT